LSFCAFSDGAGAEHGWKERKRTVGRSVDRSIGVGSMPGRHIDARVVGLFEMLWAESPEGDKFEAPLTRGGRPRSSSVVKETGR
jgi:hypothetical protein